MTRANVEKPEKNPLAAKLYQQHQETLAMLYFSLNEKYSIQECNGTVMEKETYKVRRATDEECAIVTVEHADYPLLEIDIRQDVPFQVARWLRQQARDLNALARTVEIDMQRGVFQPAPVREYVVRKSGVDLGKFPIDGDYSEFEDARQLADKFAETEVGELVCVYEDGSDDVIRDYAETDDDPQPSE